MEATYDDYHCLGKCPVCGHETNEVNILWVENGEKYKDRVLQGKCLNCGMLSGLFTTHDLLIKWWRGKADSFFKNQPERKKK